MKNEDETKQSAKVSNDVYRMSDIYDEIDDCSTNHYECITHQAQSSYVADASLNLYNEIDESPTKRKTTSSYTKLSQHKSDEQNVRYGNCPSIERPKDAASSAAQDVPSTMSGTLENRENNLSCETYKNESDNYYLKLMSVYSNQDSLPGLSTLADDTDVHHDKETSRSAITEGCDV